MLHLIGRIGRAESRQYCPAATNRNRPAHPDSPVQGAIDISTGMTKPDPALAQIAAQFTRHDIEWSCGAYTIIDRCTANPIARLRPIPDTDLFELFYWSSVKGRWTTFGNLGRMKLMLESAHEIIESDPMFRIPRSR